MHDDIISLKLLREICFVFLFSLISLLMFSAFQNHTEKMMNKLQLEMQQKVDDEDDRIAKTVAERERKRLVRVSFMFILGKHA